MYLIKSDVVCERLHRGDVASTTGLCYDTASRLEHLLEFGLVGVEVEIAGGFAENHKITDVVVACPCCATGRGVGIPTDRGGRCHHLSMVVVGGDGRGVGGWDAVGCCCLSMPRGQRHVTFSDIMQP